MYLQYWFTAVILTKCNTITLYAIDFHLLIVISVFKIFNFMNMPKIYEISDFYESYYDHGCSIVPQKDVLETDLIDIGYIAGLRRWWNGLFLLSYGNQRSRKFYTSSHAIRMERMKQFRRYRNRIHPLSKFRYVLSPDVLLL